MRSAYRVLPALVALVLCWGAVAGQEKKSQKKPADTAGTLMRQKLHHSQKVLEGLATANFPMISRDAEELIQLTKSEEWHVLRTARYQLSAMNFGERPKTSWPRPKARIWTVLLWRTSK